MISFMNYIFFMNENTARVTYRKGITLWLKKHGHSKKSNAIILTMSVKKCATVQDIYVVRTFEFFTEAEYFERRDRSRFEMQCIMCHFFRILTSALF